MAEAAPPAAAEAAGPGAVPANPTPTAPAPSLVAGNAVATGSLVPAAAAVVLPRDPTLPPPRRVLVVGDENLLFSTGLQEAYPDMEFTGCSVLSRSNLEAYNFDPLPAVLKGRVRHTVDPCKLGKVFVNTALFDDVILLLPGLSFGVPKELGSADRPLFAYRTHLFAFHVMRNCKMVIKSEGLLHVVWPDQNRFMTSPCGAAGIEMLQLAALCGGRPTPEVHFDVQRVPSERFWPFLLGEVPAELPEWITGTAVHSFAYDKKPIPIPLSAALLLHPDVTFVAIKDASPNAPQSPSGHSTLRAALAHEAAARRDRLSDIYGPREGKDDKPDVFGIIPEAQEDDNLLSVPMEIFMTSFDELPHLTTLLKFQICEDQLQASVASLEVLDPRLPTRIARPPPRPAGSAAPPQVGKKRSRAMAEEWAGMKFYCTLTKICTSTVEGMRRHMDGDVYKRFATASSTWASSQDRKDLIIDLAEEEELQKRQRATAPPRNTGPQVGKGCGKVGGFKGFVKGGGCNVVRGRM